MILTSNIEILDISDPFECVVNIADHNHFVKITPNSSDKKRKILAGEIIFADTQQDHLNTGIFFGDVLGDMDHRVIGFICCIATVSTK